MTALAAVPDTATSSWHFPRRAKDGGGWAEMFEDQQKDIPFGDDAGDASVAAPQTPAGADDFSQANVTGEPEAPAGEPYDVQDEAEFLDLAEKKETSPTSASEAAVRAAKAQGFAVGSEHGEEE